MTTKRLTKAGKIDKRYKNGRHPNSHKPKPNAGRKKKYEGEGVLATFRTTAQAVNNLKAEAARQGLTRNELFNKWLEGLPPYRPEE